MTTSASDWKKSSETKGLSSKPFPLEVPSGNTALVRPVGLQAFFELGIIPNSLLAVLQTILAKAKGGRPMSEKEIEKSMSSIAEDPEKIVDLLKMADAVTVHCVMEPEVHPTPEEGVERSDELLYVDEVDLEDKLFIMNFAFGGTRDLEPFRKKLASNVGPVSSISSVGRTTERSAGNRTR